METSQTLPTQMLRHGTEAPAPERLPLRAGPLTMVFEPAIGFLRYVRLGEQEILRGVYAAVRDRNWGTIRPQITPREREAGPDTFRLVFDVLCREREIDFVWHGQITGDAKGTVTFTFDGEARTTFLKNRIGFCILHPMTCAGRPCTVEHVDDTMETGRFPERIAPHQPFFEIRALTHEVAPGVRAEVRMEGDIFETEDQRNWTDASYKTYCTPLAQPFPAEVQAGTRIRQSVTLTLHGDLPVPPPAATDTGPVMVTLGKPLGPLPTLGLGMASHGGALTRRETERLRALNLAHLRVDLRLSTPDWRNVLEWAAREANALNTALEAALFLADEAEEPMRALANELARTGARVARFLVFPARGSVTSGHAVRLARQRLSATFSGVPLGAGTNANFTEFNRNREPVEHVDVVCYSVNPQVHAFDDASLVETLPTQAEAVRSARAFSGNLPIVVTPVTLRPRFNAVATSNAADSERGTLPRSADPRQMSLLTAGWTLGSIQYLSEGGAASVTYFETTGPLGVMETEEGSPAPFPPLPGAVFPLYHVLADIGEFAGGNAVGIETGDPLAVDGLALEKGGRLRVLVANLSGEEQAVRVVGLPARVRVKHLDETNAEAAMREPEAFRAATGDVAETDGGALFVTLPPFGLVRLDAEGRPA